MQLATILAINDTKTRHFQLAEYNLTVKLAELQKMYDNETNIPKRAKIQKKMAKEQQSYLSFRNLIERTEYH